MCLVVPACCLKTLRYCGVVTCVIYEQTQQRGKAGAGTGTHSRQGRQGGQGCGRRRKEGARSETRAADGPEGEIAFCCSRHLAYTALSLSVSLSLSLCRSLFFSVPSLPCVSLRTGQTLGAPFFFFLFPFSLFLVNHHHHVTTTLSSPLPPQSPYLHVPTSAPPLSTAYFVIE